jgi:predicted MFS family arabinose efflux permease
MAVVGAAGLAGASTPLALLISRFIGGAAASSYLAFTVMYASYFPSAPAAAVSRLQAVTSLGVVFGVSVGPWMAGAIGTTMLFWLAAGVGVIAVSLGTLGTSEPRPVATSESQMRPRFRDLLGNGLLVRVSLLTAAIQYVVQGAWFVFVFDWAEQQLDAAASDLALLALFSGIPAAIASWTAGRWIAPRIGAVSVVVTGFALAAVSVALVPVVPSLTHLLVLQAIGGLSRGFTLPILMGMAMLAVPVERRAGAVGFFQATYSVGMTLGPVITGAIGAAVGLAGGFWVMAAIAAGGSVVAALILPRGHSFT